MKKTLTLIFLFCSLFSFAQNNLGFNYQASVADAGGNPLANQSIAVRISLLQGSANGTEVYREIHNGVNTNANGFFSLIIGKGQVERGNFNTIEWLSNDHFLQVTVNGREIGTNQFEAVPYAKVASNMSLSDLQDVSDTAPQNGNVLSWNGSEWVPAASAGGGNTVWQQNGANIFYNGGNVGIGVNGPTSKLQIDGDIVATGLLSTDGSIETNRGVFVGNAPNGQRVWRGTYFTNNVAGVIQTYGENSSSNVELTVASSDFSHGYVAVNDKEDNLKAGFYVNEQSGGHIFTRSDNGSDNVNITYLIANPNNGYIEVTDEDGAAKVRAYVDANGNGVIAVDGTKPFFMPHPTQAGKEIWYSAIEGPEAGTYLRGTGKLVNGKAQVEFPEHFRLVINPETMTIVTTPLSAASKGIAVISKSIEGFEVQELWEGAGNYDFDWEVKAVRKGHENFKVIRDASEAAAGKPSRPLRLNSPKP